MNKAAQREAEQGKYRCHSIYPSKLSVESKKEILAGLRSSPRWIPCKYFYDEKGSLLFDKICNTKEYYPMRVEASLLKESAAEVIALCQPKNIIELGSGTSRKTRHLLNECEAQAIHPIYWPFDVCEPIVYDASMQLIKEYPWLQVEALVGDYLGGLEGFPKIRGDNLYVYIGGTIGNFDNEQAVTFLDEMKSTMNASDSMLIGFDRVKDVQVLNAAYNDSEGFTEAFNLNILEVANESMGADFKQDQFEHLAFYNESKAQIEMHLVAKQAMQVNLNSESEALDIEQDEKIFTEISRKFTEESINELLSAAGFKVKKHFEAQDGYFSLVLCQPE